MKYRIKIEDVLQGEGHSVRVEAGGKTNEVTDGNESRALRIYTDLLAAMRVLNSPMNGTLMNVIVALDAALNNDELEADHESVSVPDSPE